MHPVLQRGRQPHQAGPVAQHGPQIAGGLRLRGGRLDGSVACRDGGDARLSVQADGTTLLGTVDGVAVTGTMAIVAFLQFGTISMALFVSSVSLVITSIEGWILTPWLTSRRPS